jgi:hypothetical protein
MLKEPRTRARVGWAVAILLLVVHFGLAWSVRSPAVLTDGDDARYYLLGQSLREWQYANTWEVGQPAHRDYPPGYPAVLSLWGSVHGDDYDLLILLNVAASTAALLMVFLFVKRRWSEPAALLSVVSLFANPHMVRLAGLLRPESIYMALSLAALGLAASSPSSGGRRLWAGGLAILAALTRGLGIALLPALFLHWVQERRLRVAAVFTAVSAATVGSWLLWSFVGPTGAVDGMYGSDFVLGMEAEPRSVGRQFLVRIAHHVPRYIAAVFPHSLMLPAVDGTVVDNLVLGGGAALAGAAGLWLFYRHWRPAAYYLLAYGAILAVWPWFSSRFIVPLLVLIAPAVLLGCEAIVGRVSRRLAPAAMTIIALTMAVGGGLESTRLVRRAAACERGSRPPDESCLSRDSESFFRAVAYVGSELPDDAVVFSGRPATLNLYTDRMTVSRSRVLSSAMADSVGLASLRGEGVTHLLISHVKNTELDLAAELVSRCADLSLVTIFEPRALLLEVPPDGQSPDNEAACEALRAYRGATTDPVTGLPLDLEREWPPRRLPDRR